MLWVIGEYNTISQRTKHTNAAGSVSTWHYTQRGQVKQFTDRMGRSIDYAYSKSGQIHSLTNANNAKYQFKYSPTGQLTHETRINGVQRELDYNLNGEQRRNEQYSHDMMGRMIGASGYGANGEHSTQYHYDALGRRTRKVVTKQRNNGTTVQDTTRFVWLGMRMVQVQHHDVLQTYIYSPDSPYRPMARVDQNLLTVEGGQRAGKAQTVFHHNAHDNGQIQTVTDTEGDVVWA